MKKICYLVGEKCILLGLLCFPLGLYHSPASPSAKFCFSSLSHKCWFQAHSILNKMHADLISESASQRTQLAMSLPWRDEETEAQRLIDLPSMTHLLLNERANIKIHLITLYLQFNLITPTSNSIWFHYSSTSFGTTSMTNTQITSWNLCTFLKVEL